MKIDLAKKISKNIFWIVKVVGEEADKQGIPAYIVGGPVRDIFLGVKIKDLDFVVEGDGIKFAEALNDIFKGKLAVYKAFGTATINVGNDRIDIATARKESYENTASYPKVKPSSIKDDLFRRDFTINAIAVSINKACFGTVVDFNGGVVDIKKGIIRVMHEKSFEDDPTRIFRAVRFSTRFGFKIAGSTKKLIKKALLDGILSCVNKGRIKKEIELFLQEQNPSGCLEEFARLI